MTLVLIFVSIINSISVSLGVGASTVTLTHFFVAIADGTIDEAERRMLGVAYIILRVAMFLILLTTLPLLYAEYTTNHLSTFSYSQLIVMGLLFLNAILMSFRIIPSTIGPAIQAGSWYALGILFALRSLTLTNFSLLSFLMGYVTWLVFAIGFVNAIMSVLKSRKKSTH